MFKSTSTQLILLGVLAVIVGIIAIAWPGVTVLALVILFAIYAFIDAGLQTVRAFSSGTAGPVFGHLFLALIDLAAGVIALVWPAPTALVLVLVVGIWAFIGGIAEIVAGFGSGEPSRSRPPRSHELRGSFPHPTGSLCTLRPRRYQTHPQHSLPGGSLGPTRAGPSPAGSR